MDNAIDHPRESARDVQGRYRSGTGPKHCAQCNRGGACRGASKFARRASTSHKQHFPGIKLTLCAGAVHIARTSSRPALGDPKRIHHACRESDHNCQRMGGANVRTTRGPSPMAVGGRAVYILDMCVHPLNNLFVPASPH
jgi:hypothetical protein